MLAFINGILGFALLIAGRRIFWIFIGVLGFVTGAQLANNLLQGPEWLVIVIGLIIGFLFALLAVSIQAIAIGVSGFLAGGYVLTVITGMFGLNDGLLSWGILFVIGGIIGVLLVSFLFDWAVITLSSIAGSSLVTSSFFSDTSNSRLIFIILFIVGIFIQGYLLRTEKK